MSFDLKVQIDTSDAKGKPAEVASELDKMTAAEDRAAAGAKRISGGLTELGAALGIAAKETTGLGAATDAATGLTGRQLKILEALRAPAKEYAAQLSALKGLLSLTAISTGEYEQQLIRLQRATGVTSGIEAQAAIALERQASVYDRIRGPMQRYEADMAALDALMKQGTITAIEYETEFQKLASQYGTMHGPIAPQNAAPAAAPGGDGGTGQLGQGLSTAASLLSGGAIGIGVVGLTHQISDLVERFHDLDDVAIKATNHALKFADASRTTTQVVDEQLQMAKELNTQYSKTIDLYDTVRSGTDNLNISRKDQLELEKSLGKIYQISNGSLEGATGFMNRFSYAMAAGSINAHTLTGLMKQASDVGDLWVSHFKTDREGLLAMVRAGSVTVEDLTRAIMDEGKAIDANFAKRTAQHADVMAQYHEEDAILAKRYDTGAGTGHMTQSVIDAMKAQAKGSAFGYEEISRLADQNFLNAWGNKQVDLAKEALAQIKDESTRAWTDWFNDIKNLTGPFQEFGDKYRKYIGDTQAVRREVEKLNEPIQAARVELDTLNKAFETGQIGAQEFTKKYIELSTAINHGLTPEVFRYSVPIDEAKRSLDDLKKATDAHTVSGEYARKRYDELLTTLNDGRLPSTIKLWESWTLPLREINADIEGLNALFRAGRVDASHYNVEIAKLYASVPADQTAGQPTDELGRVGPKKVGGVGVNVSIDNSIRDIPKPGPRASLTSHADIQESIAAARNQDSTTRDLNEQFDRQFKLIEEFEAPAITYKHALEDISGAQEHLALTQEQAIALQRRAKSAYNDAMEALVRTRGPTEQYEQAVRRLNDQLEAGEIAQKKYDDGLDAAKVALLQATGAADTFQGAIQIEWIKMQGEADAFGASVAKLAVSDFGKLNDALVTAANGGQVAWGQMADSIIQDLERIALKMLEVKAITAILGAFGGSEGSAFSAALSSDGIVHAARGYDGIVQGPGGVDSRLFASMVTPGERVTITPPGAYPSSGGGYGGGSAVPAGATRVPSVHIHNHYDSTVGLATIDSRQGNQTVLNVMRANQGAVRSYSGTRR